MSNISYNSKVLTGPWHRTDWAEHKPLPADLQKIKDALINRSTKGKKS